MADVRISELPAGSSAGLTDEIHANQGGTSKKLTVAAILAAAFVNTVPTIGFYSPSAGNIRTAQNLIVDGALSVGGAAAVTVDTTSPALGVRNTTAGAAKFTRFSLGNDTSATLAELYTFSSTYTESAWEKRGGFGIYSSGSPGISLVSQSGDVRVFAGSLSATTGVFSSAGLALTGTLSLGTGNSTTAGLRLGRGSTDGGYSGYGHMWPENVTPGTANYSFAARYDGSQTILNAVTGGAIYHSVNDTVVTTTSATGLAVTGTLSATDAIGSSKSTNGFFDGLTVRNTNAGSSAVTRFLIGNDASSGAAQLVVYSNAHAKSLQFDVINAHAAPLVFGVNAGENARINASGYLKAAENGTYYSPTGTYHEFGQNLANNYTIFVRQSSAGPYGVQIYYDTAANVTTNPFLNMTDSGALRAEVRSNGGLANFSANNVNLSDARVKTMVRLLTDIDGFMPKLWAAGKSMRKVLGLGRYLDQTHDDDNMMYTAQGVQRAFSEVAPWIIDTFDEKAGTIGVYDHDLDNFYRAIVTESQFRIDDHESRLSSIEQRLAA